MKLYIYNTEFLNKDSGRVKCAYNVVLHFMEYKKNKLQIHLFYKYSVGACIRNIK